MSNHPNIWRIVIPIAAAAMLILHGPAISQETTALPMRQDFVGQRPMPPPPAAHEPVATAPPLRRDFIGRRDRPAAPGDASPPRVGPPRRLDFEGRRGRSGDAPLEGDAPPREEKDR